MAQEAKDHCCGRGSIPSLGTYTYCERAKKKKKDGGRDWIDASICRGMPGARGYWKCQKKLCPGGFRENTGPTNTLILDI